MRAVSVDLEVDVVIVAGSKAPLEPDLAKSDLQSVTQVRFKKHLLDTRVSCKPSDGGFRSKPVQLVVRP